LRLAVLIQDWARLHLAHRNPRYATEAVRALRHALAKHLDRPAEDLDRATVVHALDSLSHRHEDKGRKTGVSSRGTPIAGRTAAYGRACFSWAIKRGTVRSNPFAELPLPTTINKRDRVLNDAEAVAVWRAACEATHPFGAIVRLLMLTGQRREEVAGMRWAELSQDLGTWTIPATRTRWWLHDLRRTLATGLQRLGVRLEVTESVLNHLSGSRAGVVGIYQRHDWAEEKRAALDAW